MEYIFDNYGYNTEVLLVKKTGENITLEEINNDEPWYFNHYDHDTQDYVPTDVLDLSDYDDCSMMFDGQSFTILDTVIKKMKFAYACFHDDSFVTEAVKTLFPTITKVIVPSKRYTTKYYLPYWMEKYNFTLADFIINSKYVILSCTGNANEFWDLNENGFIDWENIEHCSEDEDDDTN